MQVVLAALAEEIATLAQQHSGGRRQLYMHTVPLAIPPKGRRSMRADFDEYHLERRAEELLAGESANGE